MERKILWSDIGRDSHLFCIWSTLIAWANIDSSTAKFGGKPIQLKPGELVTSLDEVAKQWHFSRSVASRCLNYLKISQRIEMRSSNQGTYIKILNYSKYQDGDRSRRKRTERESRNAHETSVKPSRNDREHNEQGNNQQTNKQTTGGIETPECLVNKIWSSYSKTYKLAYGISPLRTQRTEKYLSELANEVGEGASDIVEHFLRMNRPFYIKRAHSLKTLTDNLEEVMASFAQSTSPMEANVG